MKVILLSVLMVIIASTAYAEPELFTLDNGLQVVLDEMHFAPTAVVLVQYQVGSRNETPEISGISHFAEHMLFNGTDEMPGSMFWKHVQMEGGMANGGTGYDQTTYFIYMPSSKLEKALSMEADRMHNCLMDSADIAQEVGVVMDEWRLSQDSPDRQLNYAANTAFYGDHPLGRTILGTGETIAAFNEESVRSYYETWYRPSNAILVVAGDFDASEVKEMVEEHFGSIQCTGPSPDNVPAVTDHSHPERVDLDFPAEADRFMIYFQGCTMDSPDLPALSLLAMHFAGGRLGWIERRMVNQGILTGGYASSPSGLDRTPFTFYGAVSEEADTEEAVDAILEEAYRLTEEELSPERLEMLQDYLVASDLTSITTPVGQAYRHAYNISLHGDINGYDELLEQISNLTPEEVREVAARYFKKDNMMVTVLHATEGESGSPATSTAGTTETSVPEVTDWSDLELPTEFTIPGNSISQGVEEFTLDNGLHLIVKEDHSFPNIEIMLTVPMGTRMEPAELCGITDITCELMLRGTDELDYNAFHERLAVLGSSTSLQSRFNYSLANAYGLSQHADIWFTSLSDMVRRPALNEEEFRTVQTRMLGQINRSSENPYYHAFLGIDEILLEPGNSRNASAETVAGITRNDVFEWWSTCVRPDGAVIAVVGDITPEDALALTEQHFGSWENPMAPSPEITEYTFSQAAGDTLVITMPGKIQVAEIAGCRGPSISSEDYIPFRVMGRILGSGIGSRLGQNVRETQGLAYVVGSRMDGIGSSYPSGGRFMNYLATGAPMAVRALESVIYESMLLTEESVAAEELLLEKSRSVGRQAISFDSYDSQARYLVGCAATGMPLDRDIQELQDIIDVTVEDVQEVAAKYFVGDWFVVVAGGVDENMEPL